MMKRLCLAACVLAAMQAVDAGHAERIAELPCVDFRIEGNGTYNPEILITNDCGDVVFWRMCVNYKAQLEREYFEGSLRPGETTRIETYPTEDEEFYAGLWAQIGSDVVRAPEC